MENTNIIDINNVEPVEPEIQLRELKSTDMGTICKIITAIGARQFKDCFNVDSVSNVRGEDGKINVDEIGMSIFFDVAGIVISNIPKAEDEIMRFVASVAGMSMKEVQNLSFAEYGELIVRIVTKKEFQDFFSRVMKLFVH